jgi:hypothetical protein
MAISFIMYNCCAAQFAPVKKITRLSMDAHRRTNRRSKEKKMRREK